MSALDRATSLSRFLSRLLDTRPELRREVSETLDRPFSAEDMRAWLAAQAPDERSLKPTLRRLRARVMAHIAGRDLAGLADLAEVTETMTSLADVTVAEALAVLRPPLVARHGEPRDSQGRVQEFIVIGMGKLGGRELNVSSDVDFIFVYPEDGDTDGPARIGNFEFFTRLGRQLIDALADPTGDGWVFRVDMRLRPNGDSGPLVCSFDMLENYFITQGREWERYAWIKARPMTGDRHEELARISRPFIFRKYLDFGSIAAMRDLHAQIRREVARREMANNVKLGPGGIREIEFIAQVFQLIRGGRDLALQIKPTVPVLQLLAERGFLDARKVRELSSAYDFLRRVEHRLQYLEDAQTHNLPSNPADQALIARGMGFSDYEGLLAELDDHRATVARHFEEVFSDPNRKGHSLEGIWQGADGSEQSASSLARLGYREPQASAERLAATKKGGRYQQMPAAIKSRFDALAPRVIEAAAATPEPDAALSRMLDLLDAVSRRAAYLALMQQYPQALERVAHFAAASSWAASFLTHHPILLDELLDGRLLESAPDLPAFRDQLRQALDQVEPDTERQMDILREAHHAQVFRLLAKDLYGLLTVEKLADHLSDLADLMLEETMERVWRKLPTRHRETPAFAIIAYGKLGGKELGYASDLDIVYVYDDEAPDAGMQYSRLAQRLSTWLSSRTPAGLLFETDLRLRPHGDSGLIVVNLETFRQYQLESAWPWEHQALTRARFAAGDPEIGTKFEAIRQEVLCREREPGALKAEILAMRQKMYDAHGNKSARFDLKHDRGGLIDVEFAVQYLILAHACHHPELTRNLGNIALLGIAGKLGLVPEPLAREVADAYREFRHLQHNLRLNDAHYARVPPEEVAEERKAVLELWRRVFGEG
ncbi:MAG: bifunctional [glutamate--ammonia ligase]-adenylyl-L-tyrosine phosphorylase/[glutamate--ammonia-ligase] adenylyltransferase [Rhodocyclaceae bacterium]|nr:bifunctional [glutamate--ammonia ligase]-adenylyl-L-tyrosine phosphorylase/[glutamate--ammonia-ligase] adenylyltransferase [Rhodocyclaceae bacterium]